MIEHDDPYVKAVGERIAEVLEELTELTGPNYELTLIGRCTTPELDADMIITKDDIHSIMLAIEGLNKAFQAMLKARALPERALARRLIAEHNQYKNPGKCIS